MGGDAGRLSTHAGIGDMDVRMVRHQAPPHLGCAVVGDEGVSRCDQQRGLCAEGGTDRDVLRDVHATEDDAVGAPELELRHRCRFSVLRRERAPCLDRSRTECAAAGSALLAGSRGLLVHVPRVALTPPSTSAPSTGPSRVAPGSSWRAWRDCAALAAGASCAGAELAGPAGAVWGLELRRGWVGGPGGCGLGPSSCAGAGLAGSGLAGSGLAGWGSACVGDAAASRVGSGVGWRCAKRRCRSRTSSSSSGAGPSTTAPGTTSRMDSGRDR